MSIGAVSSPFALTGKTVLVTGASSGIGRAVSIFLARLGARLVLSGRRADALAATLKELEDPDRHHVAPFDLTDLDGIVPWVNETRAAIDAPISGFVHSAGVGGPMPLRALTRKHIEQVFVPNVFAALMLLRAVSAKSVVAESASFVLMSSVAGIAGAKGLTAYAGSKGALQAIVKSAAHELAEKHVRVNAVAPAYVDTPMYDEVRQSLPGQARDTSRQLLGLVQPDEVAAAVAYLLCDAARTVTGSVLTIDAGFML